MDDTYYLLERLYLFGHESLILLLAGGLITILPGGPSISQGGIDMWFTFVGILTLLAVLVLVIVVTVLLHYMIEGVGLGCFWSLVLATIFIWALATDIFNPLDDLRAMGHLTLYSLGAI